MNPQHVVRSVVILSFLSSVHTVPVIRAQRELSGASANRTNINNECVSEDIIYEGGDEVPSPGPCERCICKPPNVECNMIKCKTNSGCKMIQRPNHCCPDYTCDCEHKGRIYNNGERLELEDAPCQVCYCKGGEVMCTSITCYERTDCQPRYLPGQCCPKYDHCPLETNGNGTGNSTVVGSKREIQTWPFNKAITVKPIEVLKPSTTKVTGEPPVYPQTLRIHEILPTTPNYDRPNGKRPALSTVPKIPQKIHVEETASSMLDLISSTNKSSVAKNGTEATLDGSSAYTAADYETRETTKSPTVMTSNSAVEYSRTIPDQITTTEVVSANLSYEAVSNVNGSNETLAAFMDSSDFSTSVTTSGPVVLESDSYSTGETMTEWINTTTERLLKSGMNKENVTIVNDGSTEGDNLTELQFTSPKSEVTLDSETVDPTSSFDSKMEPLMLRGGIYDELNDTMLYNDENDVNQEDTTPPQDKLEYSVSTTQNPDQLSSSKPVGAHSALSQVFEKFVELPEHLTFSTRRSDDWLSQNYQLMPDEGAEEGEDQLSDLNVGATSHSDRRVSPPYYSGDISESYLMTGRSLAPYNPDDKDSYSEKLFSQGKIQTGINRLAKIDSDEDSSSESSSSEEMSKKFNPYEQADLYLSITGKNSSSNETILHMILTPKDLKHLAERIIKENTNKSESNLKETEVKIEWLTQDQLSKLRPESPTVNINLTKSNFTAFSQLDLKSSKLNAEAKSQHNNNSDFTTQQLIKELDEATERNALEITTILLSTIGELFDSTTVPYPSSTERPSSPNIPVTAVNNMAELLISTAPSEKQGPDASTIRVYEIRKSGNIDDKLTELFITTEGPYGPDKGSSPDFRTDSSNSWSPKSEINKRSETLSESWTDNFETTSSIPHTTDGPKKTKLPNVEPFLRQLPSTLDEKDVSILRDFLERHLSQPLSR